MTEIEILNNAFYGFFHSWGNYFLFVIEFFLIAGILFSIIEITRKR